MNMANNGWINVNDKLPPEGETVIVARKYVKPGKGETRYVETAELIGSDWLSLNDEYKVNRQYHTDPYAWMPMPKPPNEDDDDEQ